jgi:hypothetical protein
MIYQSGERKDSLMLVLWRGLWIKGVFGDTRVRDLR